MKVAWILEGVCTIDEIPTKAFVGRLAKREMYQSGKIEFVPIMSKKKLPLSDHACKIILILPCSNMF
jgi:hypothetical protein